MPFDSARIEVSPKATRDPQKGNVYIEMASSIMDSVTANTLYRIDVNFKIKKKNIDSLIGRSAHI